MSREHSPYETHHGLDAVSEDIIPPIAKSSVMSRTREQYAHMTPDERRDFKLAVLSTFGGVALTITAYIVEKQRPESKLPTFLRAVGYGLDYADGYFAKRTAKPGHNGASTEFGGVADPLADKFNNTLNEISLVQSGKLRQSDLMIRALRDVGITGIRRHITKHTNGDVDVKANAFGKLNTAVRDSVNLYASTKSATRHPHINRTLQAGANIYSIASGVYTAYRLIQAYRKSK